MAGHSNPKETWLMTAIFSNLGRHTEALTYYDKDVNFQGKTGQTIGPGCYNRLDSIGMKDDAIGSLRPV